MARWLFLLMFSCSALAATEVYKVVRPDGTVEYSEEPRPGAERIEVTPVPTYKAPSVPVAPRKAAPPTPTPTGAPAYRRVAITTPAQDETVVGTGGTVSVSVEVEPRLEPKTGHRVVLFLDGQRVAKGIGPAFTLTEVDRGTHTLTAAVEDGQGKVLRQSEPVSFHLRQHSRLFKQPKGPSN